VEVEQILRDFGLILGAGLVAQFIATFLRIPEMILLVAAGALIGPSVLGIVENPLNGVGAQLIFTIGVAMILFHGGVGISLRVISQTAVGLTLLVLPGIFITAFIVALAVAPIFEVSLLVAFMIGAVLASTDPAIIIPLFERLGLRQKVSQTVIAESAFNDVTGTVLVLTMVEVVEAGHFTVTAPIFEFSKELALGAVIGVGAGLLLAYAVSSTARAGIWDESPGVAILAVVALVYFSSETLGGSAYLAAFVMGLIVGNMGHFRLRQHEESEKLLEDFVGQVAEIAVLLVFVTLGINLPFDALGKYLLGGLGDRAGLSSPRPEGTLDARRDYFPELVPLHRGHPRGRGEYTPGPRGRGRRDRGLARRARRGRDPPLAGHHRWLAGTQARPDRGS
jgi:cell volume regulation protein A